MEFNNKQLILVGEDYIVEEVIKPRLSKPGPGDSLGPLDDARDLIPRGPRLVFSIDGGSISGMKLPWRTYADIGWAAVTGALSDHLAKASYPYGFMVAVGVQPSLGIGSLNELISGVYAASKHYGVKYLGGDTNSARDGWIAVSVIGFTTAKKLPRRDGARPGDAIVVVGEYGAMGLIAMHGSGISEIMPWIKDATQRPTINMALAEVVAQNYRWIHASMDVSDGLGYTLYKVSIESGILSRVYRMPPVRSEVWEACSYDEKRVWEAVLNGGEEYGAVFYVDPGGLKHFTSQLEEAGITYSIVGEALQDKPGLRIGDYKPGELTIYRWDQFRTWTRIGINE